MRQNRFTYHNHPPSNAAIIRQNVRWNNGCLIDLSKYFRQKMTKMSSKYMYISPDFPLTGSTFSSNAVTLFEDDVRVLMLPSVCLLNQIFVTETGNSMIFDDVIMARHSPFNDINISPCRWFVHKNICSHGYQSNSWPRWQDVHCFVARFFINPYIHIPIEVEKLT